MRKIIGVIILVLFAVSVQAQSYMPVSTYGYQWKRGKFDIALLIPQGDGSTLPSDTIRNGALRYGITSGTLQIWKNGSWSNISSGVALALDSARRSNDTLFFRYTTGGELAVKIDYITASHGLTKTGSDIQLGGSFGTDFNDITVLGYQGSNLLLQGTTGTNYNTDPDASQLKITGGLVEIAETNRTHGGFETFRHGTGVVSFFGTASKNFWAYGINGSTRLDIDQDSIGLQSKLIGMVGPVRINSVMNNTNADSTLYTDSTGNLKQRFLAIANVKNLADSLINIRQNYQIDTIQGVSGLYTYSGNAKILLVKDSIRGGIFYKTSYQNASDSGTVFGNWNRQYQKGIVHVGWFGGKTDIHIQQAINVADTGGTVYLQPRSRYIIYATINPRDGQRILGNFDTLQRCNEVKAVLQTAISIGGGNRVFDVSSATGFTVGGLINFYSASNSNGSTAVHKILSISGNTITTDSALSYQQAYAVGDTVITEFTMIANHFGGGTYLKNVAVDNIVFDGNKANNTSHIYWAFNAAASLYCDNLKVSECYFINSKADGLIMGGDNPIVTHCTFLNGNSNGVHLSGTYHPVICNNYFYNNNLNINTLHNEGHVTFSDSIFQADIYSNYFRKTTLSGVGRVGSSLNGGSSNVSIHDNVFDSCLFAPVNIGNASVLNPSIFNLNISNNRIYNCGRLGVTGIGGTLDRTLGPGRTNIIGNLFINSFVALTRSNNINMSGNTFYKDASFVATQASYVFLIDNENITITGNHFMGNIAYALACDNSTTLTGTYKDKGYLISNNEFIDQSIRSIQFVSKNSGTFENIKISNNNFKNSVSANAIVNIGSGIEFSYNTMNITNGSASAAIACQFGGTSLLDSAKNVLIKGNSIRITSGYAIRIGYGTGVQVINNTYNIGSNVSKPVQDSATNGAYYAYNKITDSSYTGIGMAVPLANFHASGSVRFDLGSDAKYDTYYRDSVTGNMVRLPTGTYGQLRYAGPGGIPQWHTLIAGDIPDLPTYVKVADTATAFAGYALLNGRSGGQTLHGSNAVSGNEVLTLKATPSTTTPFTIDSSGMKGGDGPASANAVFKASKTYVNPTSNPMGFRADITAVLTTSPYAGGILGGQFTPAIGTQNTQNWTGAAAMQGVSAAPTIAAGATGTVGGVIGGTFSPNLLSSGTTVTNLVALRAYYASALGTITNKTLLLLGQSTPALGAWNIYSNSSDNTYLGTGNTLVNISVDNGLGQKLQVNGRVSIFRATQSSDAVSKAQLDSSAHASPGTPTFTPAANINNFLGTGYSLTVTGDGDMTTVTLTTGTGIISTGTIGNINLITSYPSTPISVWSPGNVSAAIGGTGVGFNATSANTIIMFNSTAFAASTTYIWNISTGL